MTDHLLVDTQGGITFLTMNRPNAMNALSVEMRMAIYDALDEAEADPAIRCVVLRGAGGNFMAGGDVKSFARDFAPMAPEKRRAAFERRVNAVNPVMMRLSRMPKPVIASVSGAAAGAGMSFVAACDLAIAASDAVFRFSYSAIGATPDAGGSFFLPRLAGTRRAMELALLGDRIDAATAERYNIVNFVVAPETLESETLALAERIASGPTFAYGCIKEQINASHGHSLEQQLAMEARNFGRCAASEDWVEGVTAFASKRKPVFKGR